MTEIVVALIVVGIALFALSLIRKSQDGDVAEPERPQPRAAVAAEPEPKREAPKAEEPAPKIEAKAEEPAPEPEPEPAEAQPVAAEPAEAEPAEAQPAAAEPAEEQPAQEEVAAAPAEEPEDDADAVATLAAGGAPVELPEDDVIDDPILAVARELYQAGEFADAADAYESMLLDDPTSRRALEPLVDLYTKLESWAELQRTLYMLADVVEDDKRRVGLMLRAAHVSEERLGDTDGARDRYEQILELDPNSSIARERLESLNAG